MQNTLPVGTILRNQYLVQKLLRKGARSAVYLVSSVSLAADPHGNRYVSTRLILQEVIIPERRLLHHIDFETVSLKELDHEALPHIYDVFTSNQYNRLYLLTEYIEGSNLEQVRLQEPDKLLPLSQVMNVMAPILDAVSYLHSRHPPIVHQNIRPTSIILSEANDRTVLGSFGVGKQYNLGSLAVPVRRSVRGYEAPEQYSGAISTRTDIYGLGATFYTLLTGSVPTGALQRERLLASEHLDPLHPVDQLVPAISARVATAIQRAMSLDGNARFPTVAQFAQALKAEPVPQPPEPVTTGSTWQDQQAPPPHVEPVDAEAHKPRMPLEVPAAAPLSPVLPGRAAETPPSLPVAEPAPALNADTMVQRTTEPANASSASGHAPPEEVRSPVGVALRKPARALRSRKPGKLLLTLVALFVTLLASLGVGTSLWFYIAGHHHPVPSSAPQLGRTPPHPAVNPYPTIMPTPVSTLPLYPKLTGIYSGTLHDIPTSLTTNISLTGIQQQWGGISGYFGGMPTSGLFNGIPENGPFEGTITIAKQIQFTVASDTGQATISFDGEMQSGGIIVGTYCSLGVVTGKCSDYGLWSVSPGQ